MMEIQLHVVLFHDDDLWQVVSKNRVVIPSGIFGSGGFAEKQRKE
jgi:hypothetical protein